MLKWRSEAIRDVEREIRVRLRRSAAAVREEAERLAGGTDEIAAGGVRGKLAARVGTVDPDLIDAELGTPAIRATRPLSRALIEGRERAADAVESTTGETAPAAYRPGEPDPTRRRRR